MKNTIFFAAIAGILLLSASCNNSTDSKKQAEEANNSKIDSAKTADTTKANSAMAGIKPDADFAVAAADGGLLEVQLGKMATEKGVSSQIKKLGAMMVKDHSAANAELKNTAKEKNITLPDMLSDKCQKEVQELSGKNGTDFDNAYADLMVSDHKEDIDEFNKEAEKGNDPQLSAWAKSKVPTLQHHLAMAEEAKKNIGKSK